MRIVDRIILEKTTQKTALRYFGFKKMRTMTLSSESTMVSETMKTKNTTQISVRIHNEIYDKLPDKKKAGYINTSLQTFQETGELSAEDILELQQNLKEVTDQKNSYFAALYAFFKLFHSNSSNISITDDQRDFFVELYKVEFNNGRKPRN